MGKFHFKAEIPLTAAEFWHVKNSAEFQSFQMREFQIEGVEEVERWEDDANTYHRIKNVSAVPLPGMVKSLLGGGELVYHDLHTVPKKMPPYRYSGCMGGSGVGF
jgi:hypothetical protein